MREITAVITVAIASISTVIGLLAEAAEQSPTGSSPVERAAVGGTAKDLVDGLNRLQNEAEDFLRATNAARMRFDLEQSALHKERVVGRTRQGD
jgi:hypothetical protein